MTLYLSNAFSLAMIPHGGLLKITELQDEQVKDLIKNPFVSVVGHKATADFISLLLQLEVAMNRIAVSLQEGDKVIVMQLQSRLEEGKILSPEELSSIKYKWMLVEVLEG